MYLTWVDNINCWMWTMIQRDNQKGKIMLTHGVKQNLVKIGLLI